MKKLFIALLFLTLTTCVYANEQTVLNDALVAFYSGIKAQGANPEEATQTDKYLTGLLIVGQRYMAQFKGEDAVTAGKLIIKYQPNSKIWTDPSTKLMGQFMIVYGYTMDMNFIEAHKALNQMSIYKNYKQYNEMYNSASNFLTLVEQQYNQARNMGYQTPAEQRRAIMKKMGY